MKHLISCVNTYRVGTVTEALRLREQLEQSTNYELVKFSYTEKAIKEKGEVVETYQLVKVTLKFNDEKEPENNVQAWYGYPESEVNISE